MNTFTFNVAQSLIRHATGEEYGDGYTVTALGVGYAEPGYHDSETVFALGNWNDRQPWRSRSNDLPLTDAEAMPPVLAQALERAGVQIEWSDEWTECQECWRIVRTSADSYGWIASYTFLEDVGPVCKDCLVEKYSEEALKPFVNDPSRAVTFFTDEQLSEYGYTRHPGDFEHGWHPGQTDDPARILADILESNPDAQVVFLIDGVGQFEIDFSAYVKTVDTTQQTV